MTGAGAAAWGAWARGLVVDGLYEDSARDHGGCASMGVDACVEAGRVELLAAGGEDGALDQTHGADTADSPRGTALRGRRSD